MTEQRKVGVVLFNLGGPDSLEAVEPFLFNLFNDPAIIGAPTPIRFLLAKFISRRRAPIAQDIYRQLGGASPIVAETKAQARVLTILLQSRGLDVHVAIAMRYWHPFAKEAVHELRQAGVKDVVLLPLYPQFSTSTTASSISDWHRAASGINLPIHTVCCYPTHSGFINAHKTLIEKTLNDAGVTDLSHVRFLFSAHGLPERIVKRGDPYPSQVEATVRAVADALGGGIDAVVCYQSRVGPLKWIGPSTEEELRRAGRDGKTVALVPISFVSEHSETLVELDIEYRHLAETAGVPRYIRVPTLSVAPAFIAALGDLVMDALDDRRQDRWRCLAGAVCGRSR